MSDAQQYLYTCKFTHLKIEMWTLQAYTYVHVQLSNR